MLDEAGELVLQETFYAPSTDGALDHLFARREAIKGRIEAIAGFMDGEARMALGCFLSGYSVANRERYVPRADELLNVERAIASLDAGLWDEAMRMTDVMDCMPEARRNEWNEQIRKHETPPFTPDAVGPTFEFLLTSRHRFLAEKVDGLFRNLSRTHVTNQPEGFGKRMILPYVLSPWSNYANGDKAGYIHDLRGVIARFMGRDEPHYNDTTAAIAWAVECAGKWITIDGGALRLRVYTGVKTGHLEVHPDMAWRLNAILASLHPAAIPSQFREPPKRKVREFALMQKPLPFAVIGLLRCLAGEGNERKIGYGQDPDKAQRKRLAEVMQAIGGAESGGGWVFDYDPSDVLSEIIVSGCIPDAVSHQFYPTPAWLAAQAVAAAEIGPDDECLEPSAGLGALADLMPMDRTQCVEISEIHCAVLRAKGHCVTEEDFLAWEPAGVKFDRVVMNPPFSEGRWLAHVEHAASMVYPGGRLVAILPESAMRKRLLPGWTIRWGEVHKFPGTSISVSILTADREAA